jgi:hypothetical protein
MRDLCLDEGILQSFYDGQLEPEVLEQVSSHLASCSVCKESARQVESEMELTSGALAAELSMSIPSERLRIRIDEAIAGLNSQPGLHEHGIRSRFSDWLSAFASNFGLSPQRAIGFASMTAVFVLVAVIGLIAMRGQTTESGLELANSTSEDPADLVFDGPKTTEVAVKDTTVKRTSPKKSVRVRPSGSANEMLAAHRMLPGEKNYLQAISLLTDAIEANGETALKPTLLADYKRNLEVVNQAVVATQRTARTNPKSPDAAEMLFAVYQSKLDLLSAVAEQSRPMLAQR